VDVPVLRGERVLLRPVAPQDRDARQRLGFDADIERGYGVVRESGPMTDEEADDWYAAMVATATDPSRMAWVVEAQSSLAGMAFLQGIREVDAKARFAIGLFSPELTGRGLGGEATRLVLAHAFGPMALHRVDLRVLDFNHRAIAMYRRCGFVVEGRERGSCRMGDAWVDDVMMGVLVDEFRGGSQLDHH
jgi:RimJ/RimL family protein N-acetyltransferase